MGKRRRPRDVLDEKLAGIPDTTDQIQRTAAKWEAIADIVLDYAAAFDRMIDRFPLLAELFEGEEDDDPIKE